MIFWAVTCFIASYGADQSLASAIPPRSTGIVDETTGNVLRGCGFGLPHVVLDLLQEMMQQNISFAGAVSLANRFRNEFSARGLQSNNSVVPDAAPDLDLDSLFDNLLEDDYVHEDSYLIDPELVKGALNIDSPPFAYDSITIDPPAWEPDTVQSMLALSPVWRRLLRFSRGDSVSDKVTKMARKACVLMEMEAEEPKLKDNMPVSCFIQELLLGLAECTSDDVLRQAGTCKTYFPATIRSRIDGLPPGECHPYQDMTDGLRSLELEDIRPVPTLLPRNLRDRELYLYLTLYAGINQIYNLAQIDIDLCQSQEELQQMEFIPGWPTIHVIKKTYVQELTKPIHFPTHTDSSDDNAPLKTAIEPLEEILDTLDPPLGDKIHDPPFIAISANSDDPCSMAIGIRGTMISAEWVTNMHYWAVPFASLELEDGKATLTQAGLVGTIAAVSGNIRSVLERQSKLHNCTCASTRIITYGHSQGGGLAALLAYHLGKLYGQKGCGIRVDGVFFSAPKMFTATALEDFRRLVNARQVIDVADPLKHFPCTDPPIAFPRCRRQRYLPKGVGLDTWVGHVGTVELKADVSNIAKNEGVPKDDEYGMHDSTGPLESINSWLMQLPQLTGAIVQSIIQSLWPVAPPAPTELVAAHLSSHGCVLSSRACENPKWKWLCDRVGHFIQ